jgi:hypothetical protein
LFSIPAFFQVLNDKSTETKLKTLNLSLPLLHITPNDRQLKDQLKETYNELIQNILQECTFEAKHFDECRQVLTFALAHPLFDNVQKQSYQKWTDLIDKAETEVNADTSVSGGDTVEKKSLSPVNIGIDVGDVNRNGEDALKLEQIEKNNVMLKKKLFLEKAYSTPVNLGESKSSGPFNLISKSF